MEVREQIMGVIFEVIDRMNESRDPAQQLEKSVNAVLIGDSGKLDSLGFVNLVVDLEGRIQEVFNKEISVVDLVLMKEFRQVSVASLADLLTEGINHQES